ncbi:MAG TPA: hypothetical protein VGG28_06390 [Kofleriaceae bacterium]|jgi:TPR repeat protein
MKAFALVLLLATVASADTPSSAAAAAKLTAKLHHDCTANDAPACASLGSFAEEDYLDTKTGYHHSPDAKTARWAYERAVTLLDDTCTGGDGAACWDIARVYFSDVLRDNAKRATYLERACDAHVGGACQERGALIGRSKLAAVPWSQRACEAGNDESCKQLAITVLGAFALDDAAPPTNGAELHRTLEHTTARHDGELPIALAVASIWAGDRATALRELAAARIPDEDRFHIFASYAELVAADGIDRPRARTAWQRLQQLAPKRDDGTYRHQMLRSDYSFADPAPLMTRAEQIAKRN